MHTFLWWSPDVIVERDVQLVADAGFGWIKQNIGWRDVEKYADLGAIPAGSRAERSAERPW